MSETPKDVSARARLVLNGDLDVRRAPKHYASLMEALAQAQDLEVDLSQVGEVDSAGVQLLMLAKRAATKQSKALRLVGHSPAVLKVFQLLELGTFFGDVQYEHATEQE